MYNKREKGLMGWLNMKNRNEEKNDGRMRNKRLKINGMAQWATLGSPLLVARKIVPILTIDIFKSKNR